MRIIIAFLLLSNFVYSQKVALTPLSFQKEFELKNAGMNNVLKDYTEFASSPFKKTPIGFTLSEPSVFYKFDTLNCSLFIKKREDVDGLHYYKDCEDGRWCVYIEYDGVVDLDGNNPGKRERCQKAREGCCEMLNNSDTSALFYHSEMVDFPSFLDLDGNIPQSLISEKYVSNKEYDEFRNFVLDSMIRYILSENYPEKFRVPSYAKLGDTRLDYKLKYDLNDSDVNSVVAELYYPQFEKNKLKKEWDGRKITYQSIGYFHHFNRLSQICLDCNHPVWNDQCGRAVKSCAMNNSGFEYSEILMLSGYFSAKRKAESASEKKIHEYLNRRTYLTIQPDSLIWIHGKDDHSSHGIFYDIYASQNYSIGKQYENYPVTGVNYWQAKAFLEWKTIQHNKNLITEKKQYRVLYTLPLPEETKPISPAKVTMPAGNLEKYVITNEEYLEFVTYVVDSIVISMKLNEANGPSENHIRKTLSIEEVDLYGEKLLEEEWRHNRKYYDNYYLKSMETLQKDSLFEYYSPFFIPEYVTAVYGYSGFDTRKMFYRYRWTFYQADSIRDRSDLNLNQFPNYGHVYAMADRSDFIIRENVNIFPGYNAKEFSRIDYANNIRQWNEIQKRGLSLKEHAAIRDTLDPESFNFIGTMRWESDTVSEIKLMFYDFKKDPDAQIHAITYEQAKAYYHWKNEVPYIPTKEEWNLIKQGINPYEEKELEVPGSFFRYVIRVYPVREE